jgi:hypothetical protein
MIFKSSILPIDFLNLATSIHTFILHLLTKFSFIKQPYGQIWIHMGWVHVDTYWTALNWSDHIITYIFNKNINKLGLSCTKLSWVSLTSYSQLCYLASYPAMLATSQVSWNILLNNHLRQTPQFIPIIIPNNNPIFSNTKYHSQLKSHDHPNC